MCIYFNVHVYIHVCKYVSISLLITVNIIHVYCVYVYFVCSDLFVMTSKVTFNWMRALQVFPFAYLSNDVLCRTIKQNY